MNRDIKECKRERGITLVALVITIVILLILAGVSLLLLFGENGIITRAREAKERTYIAAAEEAVSSGWTLCEMNYTTGPGDVEKQNYFEQNIKECIDSQNEEGSYVEAESVIDVAGTSTVKYLYKDNIYTFEVDSNGNVTYIGKKNQNSKKDDIPRVEPPASEYKLVGDVYCNSPDLSGFARDATYYVTYDDSGNETVAGRIDTIQAPNNWYDYSENAKKWANIVTITEDQVAYWVWIPKYVYSLDTTNKSVNTCFVTKDTTASTTEYSYKTKEGDKTVSASEYQMPESFTFGEQNLAGIWVSKYEISESTTTTKEELKFDKKGNKLTVTTSNPSGNYTVFVDGVEKYNGSLPYVIKDIVEGAEYDICVVSKTNGPIGRTEYKQDVEVDISGFNKEATYYVTYDDNGNESYTRLDKSQPADWYDYNSKKWANIVTINDNQVAYWTYIPRYEYNLNSSSQQTAVKLIKKSQTKPDAGYEIPESFTFAGKNLAGIWVSKYEISESTSNTEEIKASIQNNKLIASTSNPSGDYEVYIDGNKKYTGTLPYKMNAKENTEYDVCIISKTSGPIGRQKVKRDDMEIDLSGFNKDCTYYVLYSLDGQTIESENIPISQQLTDEQKEKWHNYTEKRWANIKTTSKDGTQVAYWTWIPRYEYTLNSSSQQTAVKFIEKSKTEAEPGYVIPESFTFAGQNLSGIWVSKYEVSE